MLKWIRNNAELRASGDEDAIAIFEEYNGSVMSAFPALSDQDIFDILQYTIDGDPKPVITKEMEWTKRWQKAKIIQCK